MIAAIRQLRWAFQYRCEHPRPDPGTECPDAMANVLTLAYSDTDPEKLVTDSPNLCTADTPTSSTTDIPRTTCNTDISVGDRCAATASTHDTLDVLDASLTEKIPPSPAGATLAPWQSPLLNLPADAILTERQLDYCRFALRYGFQHPEYDDASHRLQLAVKRPQIGLGSLA